MAQELRHLISDAPRVMVVDGSKLVRKLIADGQIHMTGQRRGARYHAGKGRGRAAKKASKRKAKRRGRNGRTKRAA